LDVKGSVDELVGRLERYLDFAGIGIDDEGLMLGECTKLGVIAGLDRTCMAILEGEDGWLDTASRYIA
jgi:hypothetical protein